MRKRSISNVIKMAKETKRQIKRGIPDYNQLCPKCRLALLRLNKRNPLTMTNVKDVNGMHIKTYNYWKKMRGSLCKVCRDFVDTKDKKVLKK